MMGWSGGVYCVTMRCTAEMGSTACDSKAVSLRYLTPFILNPVHTSYYCRSNVRLCCRFFQQCRTRFFREFSSFRQSQNKLNMFNLFRRWQELQIAYTHSRTHPWFIKFNIGYGYWPTFLSNTVNNDMGRTIPRAKYNLVGGLVDTRYEIQFLHCVC